MFNSAFHGNRPGMNPKTVKTLVDGWHHLLASKDVRFSVKDYREITAQEGDIVYADPPYKTSGEYYFGMIHFGEFFGWLRNSRVATCSPSMDSREAETHRRRANRLVRRPSRD